MKHTFPFSRTLLAISLAPFLLAACGGSDDDNTAPPVVQPTGLADHTVYAMTNSATVNAVVAYRRADDGTLKLLGSYATGANGNGRKEVSAATPDDGVDVLASQGAIGFSPDKHTLVAVNSGSASITSFRIDRDGVLTRVSTVPSNGLQPNALAVSNSLVFVSNVGDTVDSFKSGISGYKLGADSSLTPIATGASAALSTPNAQPSRLTFTASGTQLAVSELNTQHVTVFPVAADGKLGTAVVNTVAEGAPFGSSFLKDNTFLLTQAMSDTVASYKLGADGQLTNITAPIATGQAATCWTVVTPDEKLLFATNSGAGTVSSYRIGTGGTLMELEAVASTLEGPTGGVVDGAASEDNRYIYALNSGLGAITVLRIESDGRLTKLQTVKDGLPAIGVQGLLAR